MKARHHGTACWTTASDSELLSEVRSRPREDPARQAACEALVTRYARIVRSHVGRYHIAHELAEDLMQVGYMGLMKAINNFDPAVGGSLPAYAEPCVSGEIKRYFRDKRWQLRVDRASQELRLRIRAATDELTQRLARVPSDSELAAHLEVSEEEIAGTRLASEVFRVASLDAPAGKDGGTYNLEDTVGAEDPRLAHAVDMESVWAHCGDLPEREQRLLMMRFYGNMTQAQIGEALGISQMHVSRLLQHALTYLRGQLAGTSEPSAA